jgi:hypothetical protein
MTSHQVRERTARFWDAWEREDPSALPPEDKGLFDLARRLQRADFQQPSQATLLRRRLRQHLMERTRHRQGRERIVATLSRPIRALAIALTLLLLIWVLQWSITNLRPQPTPATRIPPTTSPISDASSRLSPRICPSDTPPVTQTGLTDAHILGGASVQVGDFWFTLLPYCDPTLDPDEQSDIGGLGIVVQWTYDGPPIAGQVLEWWGLAGHEEQIAALDTVQLTAGGRRMGGIRLPRTAAVDLSRPEISLYFVERIEAPQGIYGALLRLTLRRGALGWLLDSSAVKALPMNSANGLPLVTPSTTVQPPVRLRLDSTPQEIQARVLQPAWESLWLEGRLTAWPDGEQRTAFVQAYLTLNGDGWALATGSLAEDQRPARAAVRDRWQAADFHNTDWQMHPLEGVHPLLSMIFPTFLQDLERTPCPRFETVYAGRLALVVDWGPDRLWIDEDSGLILRQEHYSQGIPPDGLLDTILTLDTVRFNPPPESLVAPLEFTSPPRPAAQLAVRLRIETIFIGNTQEGSLVQTRMAARLYAGDVYLGAVDFGEPGGIWCDRSPDSEQLAWVDQSYRQGQVLAWVSLTNLSQIHLGWNLPRMSSPPTWSPDGRFVAYGGCQLAECGLYVVDVATRRVRLLHNQGGMITPPLWKPDGQQIAVLRQLDEVDDGLEVVVARVSDGEILYRSAFDPITWQPSADSPIADWGVTFPQEIGSFSRCTTDPTAAPPPDPH